MLPHFEPMTLSDGYVRRDTNDTRRLRPRRGRRGVPGFFRKERLLQWLLLPIPQRVLINEPGAERARNDSSYDEAPEQNY